MNLRLGVVALFVVASCVSAPASVPASPTAEVPARGGRIVLAVENDFTSLDPLLLTDTPQWDPGGIVLDQLYDTLVAADPQTGEIRPSLATWKASSDGQTYEFDIASNATWSDGVPIVAEDMVTSIKLTIRSKTAWWRRPFSIRIEGGDDYRAGRATSVSGLAASGKHLTVRLTTPPVCTLLFPLTTLPPLPTHVFGRYLSEADPTKNADQAPEHLAPKVTSGPFLFREWRRGEEITLAANPRYWRGAPLVDELVVRVVPRPQLDAAFQNGSTDLTLRPPGALDVVRDLERRPGVRVIRTPFPGYTSIGWNTRSKTAPALADKRIRQALAYGFDVDLVLRTILEGEGGRTRQHMQVGSWSYTAGLNDYSYDPQRAEGLVRSAGYEKAPDGVFQKEGRPLALTLVAPDNDPLRARLIQLAADEYAKIGVRATPTIDATLFSRLDAKDLTLDASVVRWFWGADPNPAIFWYSDGSATNQTGYMNPDVDRAIDAGRFGPDCSIEARKRGYDTFNRILNEDQPANFLFWQNQYVITSARVRGVVTGTYVPLADTYRWWLAPK